MYGHSPYPPGYGFQPPQQKSSGATTIIVVIILVLALAGGGVGAYFYFQDDDDSPDVVADDDDEPEEPEEPDNDLEDEDLNPNDDGTVTVYLDQIPSQWEYEPTWAGGTVGILEPEVYTIPAGDGWVAAVMDGGLDTQLFPYDPDDMEPTIDDMITDFVTRNLQSIDDPEVGDVEYSDFESGSHEGVLAEMEISWDEQPDLDDTYENFAILMVDVGIEMPWVGIAAIPESLIDEYDEALEYLMSVEFEM